MIWPSYLSLDRADLQGRVERALASLADCRACPRDCRVDRLADRYSACKTGRYAIVSSCFPHFGEEDCLESQPDEGRGLPGRRAGGNQGDAPAGCADSTSEDPARG